jgi:acetyl-CoA C-acetyltransferase
MRVPQIVSILLLICASGIAEGVEPIARSAGEKKLNNLVSILLQASAVKSGDSLPFERSGPGWIFISATFKGKGEVEHGVVMMRTEADARALARIPASDGATLKHLLNLDRTPVGSVGNVVTAEDGVLEWRVG